MEQNLCLHCKEKITSSNKVAEVFCCYGCKFVYEAITASGLDNFYSIRDKFIATGLKPTISNTKYSYLDDPDYQQNINLKVEGQQATVTLSLKDMHCAACLWLLEKIPQVADNIINVKASLQKKEAKVTYNKDKIKLSEVALSFERYGYRPEIIEINETNKLFNTSKSHLRDQITRLGVAAFSTMNCMMLSSSIYEGWWSGMETKYLAYFNIMSLIVATPAIFYSANPFYKRAYSGIRAGQFHLDLPLSIGILFGYFLSFYCIIIGQGEVYFDSLTMLILLITAARVLQDFGLEKFNSKLKIDNDIFAKEANLIVSNNDTEKIETIYAKKVKANDLIQIKEGEYVPVDGEIISGTAFINTAVLTGESIPQSVKEGFTILCGSLVTSGSIIIRANKTQENSEMYLLFSSLKERIEHSAEISKKIDDRSKYFVAYVFLIAATSFSYFAYFESIQKALEVLLAVVVVSCPCALSLAAPLAFASCFYKAKKNNIFFSSSRSVELLAEAQSYFFDKTGTLTEGNIEVSKSIWEESVVNKDEILTKLILSEMGVPHPIATGLIKWATSQISEDYTYDFKLVERSIIQGEGIISSFSDGKKYRIGKEVKSTKTNNSAENLKLSNITISENDINILTISLSDQIRENTSEIIKWLSKNQKETYILSGDKEEVVQQTAKDVGININNSYSELKPKDKLKLISEIGKKPKVMVGDGINDTLAMSSAEVGISISGGLRLLQKEGTIAITNFKPEILYSAINGSTSTIKAIRINLSFSLVYNLLGTSIAAMGHLNPLLAAILMPGSSGFVILVSSIIPNFVAPRFKDHPETPKQSTKDQKWR